jgi:Lsr2
LTKKTNIRFVDDIDGTEENPGDDVQTVAFTYDAKHWEIELSKQHREEFDAAMTFWVARARRVKNSAPRGTVSRLAYGEGPKIREWATERGREVRPGGRIPMKIIIDYYAENPRPQA